MTNARNGEQAFVTLVTNQDTGIATYGLGRLVYSETKVPGPGGLKSTIEHLSTTPDAPLQLHFGEPDALRASGERIGFKVSRRLGFGTTTAEVTFLDFGNAHFTIPLHETSNCFVGLGPRFDQAGTADAVWVFSFQTIHVG
jgi:hypothetical protein